MWGGWGDSSLVPGASALLVPIFFKKVWEGAEVGKWGKAPPSLIMIFRSF